MGIPLRFVLIVLWTAFICQPLQAQGDRRAAIHLYWGCQYLVNDPVPVTKEEIEQSGKCQSAIESVLNFNKDLPHNMAFLSATALGHCDGDRQGDCRLYEKPFIASGRTLRHDGLFGVADCLALHLMATACVA